jgi:hypothetical protein
MHLACLLQSRWLLTGAWLCGAAALAVSCGGGDDGSNPPLASGGSNGQDSGQDSSGGTGGLQEAGPDGPSNGAQCALCTKDTDCAQGYRCIPAPLGDMFCAKKCETETCSSETECVDLANYGLPDAGSAGAGGSAGASGAAGAAGAAGADEAGVDSGQDASQEASAGGSSGGGAGGSGGGSAGAGGGSGLTGKACVPKGSDSCPCVAARAGVKRNCYSTNPFGSCSGKETCQANAWQGCDAVSPAKETCDGKDNNCNGFVDMDEPGITGNQLCASGQAPPHSGFTCSGGECQLSGCEPGWSKYPPSTPASEGCNCAIDPPDITALKNEACDNATDRGTVLDVGSVPVVVIGTLSSDTDTDWYGIVAKDQNELPANNTFHLRVEFQAPDGNPGDEFRFDIVRTVGTTPACDTVGLKPELLEYDWCANNADPAATSNDDATATFRIRVYRKAGAAGDCKPYKLKITNGGGGACPADDGCGQ